MLSVFISYAHADEKLKDRFLVHLGALKRERLIGVWHDRMLRPGDHLDTAIEKELAAADLIILLVSPDFINSDYCTEKKMQRAFARAKDGRCRVVAVILKPCLWKDIPIDDRGGRLGDFVALPHDGKPVARSSQARESALDSVVAGIRRLIKEELIRYSVAPIRAQCDSNTFVRTAVYSRTGHSSRCPFVPELMAKRLEMLKDILPPIRAVAMLVKPDNPFFRTVSFEAAAKSLDIELPAFEARGIDEFEPAFSAMTRKRVDAVLIPEDAVFVKNARTIADLARTQRLPSAGFNELAEAGGLIGYGVNFLAKASSRSSSPASGQWRSRSSNGGLAKRAL